MPLNAAGVIVNKCFWNFYSKIPRFLILTKMISASSGTGNCEAWNLIILNHRYCTDMCLHSGYCIQIIMSAQ